MTSAIKDVFKDSDPVAREIKTCDSVYRKSKGFRKKI